MACSGAEVDAEEEAVLEEVEAGGFEGGVEEGNARQGNRSARLPDHAISHLDMGVRLRGKDVT